MELHERLNTAVDALSRASEDPFAELKNRVHLAVIGDLGPQLFNVSIDPDELRERVLADIRDQLAQETGISRDDRQRLAHEIADDILGHGPLERLLADDIVTEIMVNGPYDIWIERAGRLSQTDRPLQRRVAPAPDHQQDGRAGRPPHRRVVADGRRAPARRQPRQRDHPAALARRAR